MAFQRYQLHKITRDDLGLTQDDFDRMAPYKQRQLFAKIEETIDDYLRWEGLRAEFIKADAQPDNTHLLEEKERRAVVIVSRIRLGFCAGVRFMVAP